MDVFTPRNPEGNPIADRSNQLWVEMNKDRFRVTVEICYSSTLGECWTLRAGGLTHARQPKPVVARVRRRLPSSSRENTGASRLNI